MEQIAEPPCSWPVSPFRNRSNTFGQPTRVAPVAATTCCAYSRTGLNQASAGGGERGRRQSAGRRRPRLGPAGPCLRAGSAAVGLGPDRPPIDRRFGGFAGGSSGELADMPTQTASPTPAAANKPNNARRPVVFMGLP